jgi:hypothetical protein
MWLALCLGLSAFAISQSINLRLLGPLVSAVGFACYGSFLFFLPVRLNLSFAQNLQQNSKAAASLPRPVRWLPVAAFALIAAGFFLQYAVNL